MAILKKFKPNNFTQIDNNFLEDRRITYGARGIGAYLLAKPNGWNITFQDLVNNSEEEGKDRVRGYLKELAKYRYWVKIEFRNSGRFETEYHLFEAPLSEIELKNFIANRMMEVEAGAVSPERETRLGTGTPERLDRHGETDPNNTHKEEYSNSNKEVSYDTSALGGDEAADEALRNLITSQFKRGAKRIRAMSDLEWLRLKHIFRDWRGERGYSATTKLTPERGRAVLERVRSPLGWTDDQFDNAMRGVKYIAHNSGVNETQTVYDDLELICRDDQRLQKFIDAFETGMREGKKPFDIQRISGRVAPPPTNGNGKTKNERTSDAIRTNATDPAFKK